MYNEISPIEGKIMKKIFLNKIKTILEKEREEILLRVQQHSNVSIDIEGDETDEIQGKILALATSQLLVRDKNKLSKIDNAFKRMKEGTFGQCLECGEDIGEKRLLINPGFTTCVGCAEHTELLAKRNGR